MLIAHNNFPRDNRPRGYFTADNMLVFSITIIIIIIKEAIDI